MYIRARACRHLARKLPGKWTDNLSLREGARCLKIEEKNFSPNTLWFLLDFEPYKLITCTEIKLYFLGISHNHIQGDTCASSLLFGGLNKQLQS